MQLWVILLSIHGAKTSTKATSEGGMAWHQRGWENSSSRRKLARRSHGSKTSQHLLHQIITCQGGIPTTRSHDQVPMSTQQQQDKHGINDHGRHWWATIHWSNWPLPHHIEPRTQLHCSYLRGRSQLHQVIPH
jgi:hypothetical protein